MRGVQSRTRSAREVVEREPPPVAPSPATRSATGTDAGAEPTPARTLYAVFVASVALLSLEIAQVRVFSYAIDPLLVFSAISVALLGVGAGGIAVSLRPQLAAARIEARLAWLLAAFSV